MKNNPSPASMDLIQMGKTYYLPNYKPREMILDHGKGARVFDMDGNDYIDFGSGIAVTSLGHSDPDLIKALTDQAQKIWHTSNIFYTEPPVRLAEELVDAVPFAKRAFFCNSGAEANEAAIKLVRKYAHLNRPADAREIITFTGSFHGRTLATVTATAQPKYQEGFGPMPGGFVYCDPFNNEEAIAKLVTDKTCAIFVEPIQGEGGIMPAKPGFLKTLRELCDKVGALLVFDEIQTGMGRTGQLFAHMHDGVVPDVMTLAKALGCGIPIGAMLVGEKAQDTLQFGSHGTTFGGNPVACAVARVALKKINTPELMAHVEKQGAALRKALAEINAQHKCYKEVRGRGLMIGAQLEDTWKGKAGDVSEIARKYGLLVLQAGPDVMRFLPPLSITSEELDAGVARLKEAMAEFCA